MTADQLRQQAAAPTGLSEELLALWHDAHGAWEQAHALVEDGRSREAAWVHAYLHRKEGDVSNASYWYTRAGQPHFRGSLEDEWTSIATALLARP